MQRRYLSKGGAFVVACCFCDPGGDTAQSLRPILKNSGQKFRTQHNKSVWYCSKPKHHPMIFPQSFSVHFLYHINVHLFRLAAERYFPHYSCMQSTYTKTILILALGHTHTHTYTQRHGCQVGIFSAKYEKMALFENSLHFIC